MINDGFSRKNGNDRMKEVLGKITPLFEVRMAPVQTIGGGLIARKGIQLKNLKNMKSISENIPYIKSAADYMADHGNSLPEVMMLFGDNRSITRKTAAFMAAQKLDSEHCSDDDDALPFDDEFYDDDNEQYAFEYDDDDDEDDEVVAFWKNVECYVVDLSFAEPAEHTAANNYLSVVASYGTYDIVIFDGLADGIDVSKKLEAIQTCNAGLKFVCMSPKQKELSSVLKFQIYTGADGLELDAVDNAYFENVARQIMKESGLKFGAGIDEKLLVNRVRSRFGEDYDELSIHWFISRAARRTSKKTLTLNDFNELGSSKKNACKELEAMVGLAAVKKAALESAALCNEMARNPKIRGMHNNMIFYGNPGTGKTTCARLLARIFAENGMSNAKCTVCTRKDLLGKYVGHTAPMVAAKFEEARNGVLFVDEAGFFLNTNAGGYVDEALKEFIRYMEEYPDVTVIFAMYEKEVNDFLQLDDGLKSRISKMLHFEDYSADELWEIACVMAEKKGYVLSGDAHAQFDEYIVLKMNQDGFGNAREVRKLIEACIVAVSLRNFTPGILKNSNVIDAVIMAEGVKSITGTKKAVKGRIGFAV